MLTRKSIRKSLETVCTFTSHVIVRTCFRAMQYCSNFTHNARRSPSGRCDGLTETEFDYIFDIGGKPVTDHKQDLDMAYVRKIGMLNYTRWYVKTSIKLDKADNIADLANEASKAHARNDTKAVFRVTRELMPAKARPPSTVLLEDGLPAATYSDARARWQRYFSDKMHGDISSISGPLALHGASANPE